MSQFAYSSDGENYSGDGYETRDLCVEAAPEELALDPGDGFYVGEAVKPSGEEWIPDGDHIIEVMKDNQGDSDSSGEWAESWLEKVKPEDLDALTDAIRATVAKWMDDTCNRPAFFTVIDVTEHLAPVEASAETKILPRPDAG